MRKSKTQTERGPRPFIQLDVEARVYPDAPDKTSVRVLTHAVQGEKGGEWFAEAERRLHSFIKQYIEFFEYNETIHAFWKGQKDEVKKRHAREGERACVVEAVDQLPMCPFEKSEQREE